MNAPVETIKAVAGLFESFGLVAADHIHADSPGRTVYGLQRGSAQIYVIISYDETRTWVQVISPILGLPSAERKAECYEHLLHLNARKLINCSFGIDEGKIVVNSDRSAENLQFDELRDMVLCVSMFADDLDDELSEQFGCEMLGPSNEA